eukprot:5376976-Alexandrium_andersonii.AAC.1
MVGVGVWSSGICRRRARVAQWRGRGRRRASASWAAVKRRASSISAKLRWFCMRGRGEWKRRLWCCRGALAILARCSTRAIV